MEAAELRRVVLRSPCVLGLSHTGKRRHHRQTHRENPLLIPTAIVMLVLFGVSVFVFSPVISMLVTAGGTDMVPTRSDRSTGARFLFITVLS